MDHKPENNKYKCIRLLGEGSFGKAFLVECQDKTLAVVKTIHLENMTEDEKKESFLEGKILEKLDHPNIIKFREVYLTRRPKLTLCIVMDFADGGDLQSKIKSQKGKFFSESLILDWFTQICLAIKHIHDRKILHRDVKSQNIFMTKNGLVKLGDFGIAKCLNCTIDKAKTIVGTPYYLSPEIVQNQPYSFKSDVWSLGILLYEMCALKMPFDAQNLPMLSLKISRGQYNPLPPLFSKELRNLVSLMLSVDINKRPTVNEILKMNIVKSRIESYLNEVEYKKEFSHTILHNYDLFKDKTKESKFANKDIQNSLQNKEYPTQSTYLNTNQNNEKKANSKENFVVNNREVNTPSQNKKPIIFDKKDSNGNVNFKNIIDINNKAEGGKNEKKNYHFEKKAMKNDSEEKKEAKNEVKNEKKRNPGSSNPTIEVSERNIGKDRKKDNKETNIINEKRPSVGSSNQSVNNDSKKKNSLSTANQSQTKEGSNEKKRSDSKSSQEEKNNIKNQAQLKDFLKNMRDKMKNSPTNREREHNNVVWVGINKEINDKEPVVLRNNFSPNNNNNIINFSPSNNNLNNKKEISNQPADMRDFINTHKMLLEMDKINKEDLHEHDDKQEVNVDLDNLNESILKELGIGNKDVLNIDLEAREDNFDEQINSKFNFEDLKDEIEKKVSMAEQLNIYTNIISNTNVVSVSASSGHNNNTNQNNMYNILKLEIENEIDKLNYEKLYKIVDEHTSPTAWFFDQEVLEKKVKEEFFSRNDHHKIELALARIPDIFCIILKDREDRS